MISRPFRFGVVCGGAASQRAWVQLAQRAEELGYATLLMPDRPSMGIWSPFTALAVAASATTTLRVGSYVFCNDYRHPAMLAREAATLDLLSEGRFELGLGAGVSALDYQQMGMEFGSAGTRVGRMEEALHIIKQFFTEAMVNFAGRYYTITDMPGLPKPVQQPHPPIFIGSGGKRMLSIAAREADSIAPALSWAPAGAAPPDVTLEEKVAWVREAAGERFAHIELSQTAYDLLVTDSQVGFAPQPVGPPTPNRSMTTEQAVEFLIEQRARLGFSYIQVTGGQMENVAPVVARLAGK